MKRLLGTLLVTALLAGIGVSSGAASATDPPPSVSITSNLPSYTSGQTATFKVNIVAHNVGYLVDYRYQGTSKWYALSEGANTQSAVRSVQVYTIYNFILRAQLFDDHGTPSDTSDDTVTTATKSVGVRAAMTIGPRPSYVMSHGYAVFARGTAPKFHAGSSPAFPGKRCNRFVVQRLAASGWKSSFLSACRIQGRGGDVDWQWAGRHPSAVKFRVRSTLAADTYNVASASNWTYFRFR